MSLMEKDLAERALRLLEHKSQDQRVLIALAGSPGSGKSTISEAIVTEINKLWRGGQNHSCQNGDEVAVLVSQDGFHYYRNELKELPNSEDAFKYRGAPFTFNSKRFLRYVEKLREPLGQGNGSVLFPDFDHSLKDPIEDAVNVTECNRIVLIEGNYVLLKDKYWNRISAIVDEKWKLNVNPEIARNRIAKRHLKAGIASTLEEAYERCDSNDMVNAYYIATNSFEPDLSFESVEKNI